MENNWKIQTKYGEFKTVEKFESAEEFEKSVYYTRGYVVVKAQNTKPLFVRSTEILYAFEDEEVKNEKNK